MPNCEKVDFIVSCPHNQDFTQQYTQQFMNQDFCGVVFSSLGKCALHSSGDLQ